MRFVKLALATLLIAGFAALQAPAAHAAGTLSVNVQGKGDVTGEGIDCDETGGPDCSQFHADTEECSPGTPPICFSIPPQVELTAGANRNGYEYSGFTGCESVAGRICSVYVNHSKAVTARFTDVERPSLSIGALPTFLRGTVRVPATATDNSGVIDRVEFRLDEELFGIDTAAPWEADLDTAALPDGWHTLEITAYDGSGLSTSRESPDYAIDNIPPGIEIFAGPDGATFGPGSTQTFEFDATDAPGMRSMRCSVGPTGSRPAFEDCEGGSYSVSDRPEGNYTFTVRATGEGGLEAERTRIFSIDATAPQTTITAGPADGSSQTDTSVSFSLAANEPGSTFECRLHRSGEMPPVFGECSNPASHGAAGLSPGTYVFEARATDPYGNVDETPVRRTFMIAPPSAPPADPDDGEEAAGPGDRPPPPSANPDRAAPQTTLLKAPKKKGRKKWARFEFTSSEAGSSFECRLDKQAFAPCGSPAKLKVRPGKHRFEVRATDAAGNTDESPAGHTWKVKRRR